MTAYGHYQNQQPVKPRGPWEQQSWNALAERQEYQRRTSESARETTSMSGFKSKF